MVLWQKFIGLIIMGIEKFLLQITTNPLFYQAVSQGNGQTNAIYFETFAAMNNVRFTIVGAFITSYCGRASTI